MQGNPEHKHADFKHLHNMEGEEEEDDMDGSLSAGSNYEEDEDGEIIMEEEDLNI